MIFTPVYFCITVYSKKCVLGRMGLLAAVPSMATEKKALHHYIAGLISSSFMHPCIGRVNPNLQMLFQPRGESGGMMRMWRREPGIFTHCLDGDMEKAPAERSSPFIKNSRGRSG